MKLNNMKWAHTQTFSLYFQINLLKLSNCPDFYSLLILIPSHLKQSIIFEEAPIHTCNAHRIRRASKIKKIIFNVMGFLWERLANEGAKVNKCKAKNCPGGGGVLAK